MSLADNRFFLPVTRALFQLLADEPAPRMLQRLGIPLTNGYRVLRFYTHHGAIATRADGIEVDARKVTTLAGGLRADVAVPARELRKCPASNAAVRLLRDEGISFTLAFRSAADRIGYFEPVETLSIFVDRADLRHAASVLTVPGARGAATLHAHALERLEILTDPTGTPITSPLQTVLDLAADPRGGAHRSFLEQVLQKRGEFPAGCPRRALPACKRRAGGGTNDPRPGPP